MSMYVVAEKFEDGQVSIHPQGYDTPMNIVEAMIEDAKSQRDGEDGDYEMYVILLGQAEILQGELAEHPGFESLEVRTDDDHTYYIQRI